MEVACKTDIGRVRKINQDYMLFKRISDDFLYTIVCDGMGGTKGGEVASKEATLKISNFLDEKLTSSINDDIINILESSIKFANSYIYDMSINNSELTGMGTTVVASIIKDNILYIAHVGDSRAYLCNKSKILQITVDHSVVQEMVDSGEITKEEARTHPRKNIITRALGIDPEVNIDSTQLEIYKNDVIMLCTDGLTNYLNQDNIQNIILNNSLENAVNEFVETANSLGGSDNITVVLVSK